MGLLLSRGYKSSCAQERALVLDRTIAVSTKGSRKGGTYDVFEVKDNLGEFWLGPSLKHQMVVSAL